MATAPSFPKLRDKVTRHWFTYSTVDETAREFLLFGEPRSVIKVLPSYYCWSYGLMQNLKVRAEVLFFHFLFSLYIFTANFP